MTLRGRSNFISSGHVTQWHIPLYLPLANILISKDNLYEPRATRVLFLVLVSNQAYFPGKEEVPRQKRPFRVKLEDSALSIWSLWSWAERGKKNPQLTWFSFLMDPSTWPCSFFLRQARHGTINYFLALCIELRLQSLGESNWKPFCCWVLNSTLTLFAEYKVTTISIVLLFAYHFPGQKSCEPCKEKMTAEEKSPRKSYLRSTKTKTLDLKTIKTERTLQTVGPTPFLGGKKLKPREETVKVRHYRKLDKENGSLAGT